MQTLAAALGRRTSVVQALMRAQLQRIVDTEGLSENVFEIASKSLKDA